ncbi:MAG: methylmalonyl Co-A mutase-associated GTPase MeaB, partial [Alphaproteobacteria bacterium]|nr:methylmalonyl Co-A mutase-associated GTPase MeaB [Alphaproteobacteria bacterium]
AGMVEMPQVVVVTKADMGSAAARARADVLGALSLAEAGPEGWRVPVLMVSSMGGEGVAELVAALDQHAEWLRQDGRLDAARLAQARLWLEEAVRERFGREGLRRAGPLSLAAGESPFRRLAALSAALLEGP